MARYHVQYTGGGQTKYAYVEGPSIEWVHAHLERRGALNVRILREDVLAAKGRNLRAEGRLAPRPGNEAARKGVLRMLPVFALAVVADLVSQSWLPWLSLCVIALTLVLVLPSWLNAVTEQASVWHEWGMVLRWLPFLEWHPTSRKPAVRFGLRLRRARALIGLGRVEEGLALFDTAVAEGRVPPRTADAMRASLLILARRYPEAIALRRSAAAGDPKLVWDTAIALLRYGGDVAEARALLNSREGEKLTELEGVARDYARGLLAVVDQSFAVAIERFDSARGLAETTMASVPAVRESYQSLIDAYRAIALAGLGEPDAAQQVFDSVSPFLLATHEDQLVAECRQAIARARAA